MDEIFTGLHVICADEGQGKSSMALSYPKPLFHMDLDLNGFRRAAWRLQGLKVKELGPEEPVIGQYFSAYDIITKPYPRTIPMDKLLGPTTDKVNGTIQIRKSNKVEGMAELWMKIITDFVIVCQQPLSRSVVIDTGDTFYVTASQSHLQFLQEKQIAAGEQDPNRLREKLQKLEYTPVYDKIRQVLYTGSGFRKNIVITSYPKPIYAESVNSQGEVIEYNTGKEEVGGFKDYTKLADLVVWVTTPAGSNGKPHPVATITKCGIADMGMGAVGMTFEANYASLEQLRQTMKVAAMFGG